MSPFRLYRRNLGSLEAHSLWQHQFDPSARTELLLTAEDPTALRLYVSSHARGVGSLRVLTLTGDVVRENRTEREEPGVRFISVVYESQHRRVEDSLTGKTVSFHTFMSHSLGNISNLGISLCYLIVFHQVLQCVS